MLRHSLSVLIAIGVLLPSAVRAADNNATTRPNESRTSAKDVKEEATLKKDDLDSEVSDIKLRASSGAKSKWSSSVFFTYAGGSLKAPGSDERPNVGKASVVAPVNMSGDVGLRFRSNVHESYFFATGFRQSKPFHAKTDDDKLINK